MQDYFKYELAHMPITVILAKNFYSNATIVTTKKITDDQKMVNTRNIFSSTVCQKIAKKTQSKPK